MVHWRPEPKLVFCRPDDSATTEQRQEFVSWSTRADGNTVDNKPVCPIYIAIMYIRDEEVDFAFF